MANPTARIRAHQKYAPFALRVVQTQDGSVYWDREDTAHQTREFIIATNGKSARRLAQWILDNVEEK
jgi:hypothetical protein